jgi:hypothetical protein
MIRRFGNRKGIWSSTPKPFDAEPGSFLVDHIADKLVKETREGAEADILRETGEDERNNQNEAVCSSISTVFPSVIP